jgi:hypothetical protein
LIRSEEAYRATIVGINWPIKIHEYDLQAYQRNGSLDGGGVLPCATGKIDARNEGYLIYLCMQGDAEECAGWSGKCGNTVELFPDKSLANTMIEVSEIENS